ncbi:hypothetical protein SAMN05421823_106126 [Catalinimonas alkaloidigena]|uniref:Uncharacterized protein n=1 Tax=Catalinimonas alkaloidigena TaxID=1075417 RepID=A0A1G9KDF5_9BACT|nr:hypothetical protein [Catalinimonas alkaloidigena]SDL47622.1 hypothetical protein SAMN05421823_106126 [Catalinimonas alkaloidigena]
MPSSYTSAGFLPTQSQSPLHQHSGFDARSTIASTAMRSSAVATVEALKVEYISQSSIGRNALPGYDYPTSKEHVHEDSPGDLGYLSVAQAAIIQDKGPSMEILEGAFAFSAIEFHIASLFRFNLN